MKNELRIIEAGLSKESGYIAIFSGTTGAGEVVKEEEAHNLFGNKEEVIESALSVWGAEREETNIDFGD